MQALKKLIKWVLMFFGAIMVLGIVVASCSSQDQSKTEAPNEQAAAIEKDAESAAVQAAAQVKPEASAEKVEEKGASKSLTGPQRNAVRSAEQYLSMSGFSRNGLINQLSSSYGDNYAKNDATAAVDSLNVDWNEQAARSAKQYLDMSGFSCQGLIDQLSSDAGDKYTRSQAAYGAKQAGACS